MIINRQFISCVPEIVYGMAVDIQADVPQAARQFGTKLLLVTFAFTEAEAMINNYEGLIEETQFTKTFDWVQI